MKKRVRKNNITKLLGKNIGSPLFIIAIALCVIVWLALHAYVRSPEFVYAYDTTGKILAGKIAPKIYRTLDGVEITGATSSLRIFGVSVEDTKDAFPLRGLSHAGVVYELPVESTITRLIALFQGYGSSFLIGPVRSVRPYFLDVIQEYGGVVVHAGGSPDALKRINDDNSIASLNEISSNGSYFERDASRPKPHNLFVSSMNVGRALEDGGLGNDRFTLSSWSYKDDYTLKVRPRKTVPIRVNDETFTYEYTTNRYVWAKKGSPQVDEVTKKTIAPKNVILLRVSEPKVLDTEGRLSVTLLGKGNATIYRDGQIIQGFWMKPTATSRLQWVDTSGKSIRINRGMTWIYVSP